MAKTKKTPTTLKKPTAAASKTAKSSVVGGPSPRKSAASKTGKKPKAEIRHVQAEIVDHDEEIRDSHEPELEGREGRDEIEARDDLDRDSDIEPAGDGDLEEASLRLPAKVGPKTLTTKDPIATYLAELRKYPVLTREQEFELAKKYHETKDPAAAQALVTANLRFVVKVAAEYSKFGARLIDLVQEGNMGLMHAVRDFNPYRGVRLITYAVWWIRGYIQEYLMKQYSMVKIGTTQNQKKLFYRLQKEKDALDALGEMPDMALIGQKLGIPEEEVREMAQRLRGRDVSLSQSFDNDSKASLLDFQPSDAENPDVTIAREEELALLREKLEDLRPQLNEREMILLEERLLADEPLTLQEIGEKYGITREAVRQTEARLMQKIRKSLIP